MTHDATGATRELAELRALRDLVSRTCGQNNCNCPTAPLVRQALKDLTPNDR